MYLTVLDLKYTKYEHQVQVQVQVQVLLNFKNQVQVQVQYIKVLVLKYKYILDPSPEFIGYELKMTCQNKVLSSVLDRLSWIFGEYTTAHRDVDKNLSQGSTGH